jgi:hypothetical protein
MRPQQAADDEAISALLRRCFVGDGEARLVEALRRHGQLVVSPPAVIFAAVLGFTGIDSCLVERSLLLSSDLACNLERNPGKGPDAQLLPVTQ